MDKEQIKEYLTQIFREALKEPDMNLTEKMNAKDSDKWDSISHMLILSNVEQKFNIKFKLKDIMRFQTVGDLIELVFEKTNE